MKYLLIIIIIIIITAGSLVQGEELDLILGGWSYHNARDKDYNEVHDNIGVEYDDWVVFTYHNSNRDRSVFAGRSVEPCKYLGFTYGVMSGYGESAVPVVIPKITLDFGRTAADIHFIPGVVTQIQFRFTLGDYGESNTLTSEPTDFAGGYDYGVLGPRFNILYRLSDTLSVRLSAGEGSHTRDEYALDYKVTKDSRLNTDTVGVFVDYFPYGGDLGLYAGIVYSKFEYTDRYHMADWVQAKGFTKIEGARVHTTDFKYIELRAKWEPITPTIGFRIGNPWADGRALSGYLDVGISYIQDLTATVRYDIPALEAFPYFKKQFDSTANDWAADREREYGQYHWLPVVQVGINYRF